MTNGDTQTLKGCADRRETSEATVGSPHPSRPSVQKQFATEGRNGRKENHQELALGRRAMRALSCWFAMVFGLMIDGSSSLTVSAAEQPNVLVILTDDQGFGDFSLHGNPHLSTPHIDRLGRACGLIGSS